MVLFSRSASGAARHAIPTSALAPGVYFVNVRTDSQALTKQFITQ
jgi:hypothetical protein